GQGMMAGTSPSITGLPGGGYEMAFQANTGRLIAYGSAGNTDTGQGMKAGTSPSIAAPRASSSVRAAIVSLARGQIGYQGPAGTFCNKFSGYWQAGTPCGGGNYAE